MASTRPAAQAIRYIELVHGQMTPEAYAQMAIQIQDYSQRAWLSLENDLMLTTLNLIMILGWLEEGDIEGIKEYGIGRIVRAYNESSERVHPELREIHATIRERADELALKMPELQKALEDSLPAAPADAIPAAAILADTPTEE